MTGMNESLLQNLPHHTGQSKNSLYLFALYFIVFSAFFDTHAQMPILTPYALALGANPFIIGLIIGSYSFFNIAGNFTSGIVIDRRSWKLPLFFGLTGVALILLSYTLASSAYHLIAVRAIHGFMGGILVPAALASLIGKDQSSDSYRPLMAIFGATIGLAAVTGPLAAGIIANRFGYQPVYYTLAALMLLAALTALGSLSRYPIEPNNKNYPALTLKQLSLNPELCGSFTFALGTMGATGTLAAFLPLRAALLDFDHAQTGMLFATFALTAIIIQIIWPRVLRNVLKKDRHGCMLGQLLLTVSLVMAAICTATGGMLVAMILFGIGFGLSFQGMLGLVLEGSQPAWRGRAIGIYFAFYSFGAAVLPPLSGLLYQQFSTLFPFYTAAAFTLIIMFAGKKQK